MPFKGDHVYNTTPTNAFGPANNALSPDTIVSPELILLPFEPGRHTITLVKMEQPLRDIGGTSFPCALISALPGPGHASFPAGQTAWFLSLGDTLSVHVQAPGAILTLVTLRPSDYAATGLHFKVTNIDKQHAASRTGAAPVWPPASPVGDTMSARPRPPLESPAQPFLAQPGQPPFAQSAPPKTPFGWGAQPREAFFTDCLARRQNSPAVGGSFNPDFQPASSAHEAPPGSNTFGSPPFATASQPPAPERQYPLSADLGFAAPRGAFPGAPFHGHPSHSPGSSYETPTARFQSFQTVVPEFGRPGGAPDMFGAPSHPVATPVSLHACAHIQNLGDVASSPGQPLGTPGSRLRLEAVAFKPEGMDPAALEYATISHEGSLSPWVSFPHFSGTHAANLPLLGFVARLTGEAARRYDVVYSGTFQKSGQAAGRRNGEFLFSTFEGDALESLAVRIIPKD